MATVCNNVLATMAGVYCSKKEWIRKIKMKKRHALFPIACNIKNRSTNNYESIIIAVP